MNVYMEAEAEPGQGLRRNAMNDELIQQVIRLSKPFDKGGAISDAPTACILALIEHLSSGLAFMPDVPTDVIWRGSRALKISVEGIQIALKQFQKIPFIKYDEFTFSRVKAMQISSMSAEARLLLSLRYGLFQVSGIDYIFGNPHFMQQTHLWARFIRQFAASEMVQINWAFEKFIRMRDCSGIGSIAEESAIISWLSAHYGFTRGFTQPPNEIQQAIALYKNWRRAVPQKEKDMFRTALQKGDYCV